MLYRDSSSGNSSNLGLNIRSNGITIKQNTLYVKILLGYANSEGDKNKIFTLDIVVFNKEERSGRLINVVW